MSSLRPVSAVFLALMTVSLAYAADSAERISAVRAPETLNRQALTARLNKSTLRSLSARITPTEQLRLLKLNPAYAGQTFNVPAQTTHVTSTDPWNTGITLTPFVPAFPAGVISNYTLGLSTNAGMLAPYLPLPLPSQNPAAFWLYTPDNEVPLFTIEAHFPAPGGYLITFVMCDIWPASPACPRVKVPSLNQKVDLVGNKTRGADKWTMLWNALPGTYANESIEVYPSSMNLGFNFCCLSKIVISRLP
ncbi:MAG: hypothetical protein WCP21_10085 [Armatimonadota bacterium]